MSDQDGMEPDLLPPSLADTAASRPELWGGPAWVLFASRPKRVPAVVLSGYRRWLAEWEHHLEPIPATDHPPVAPGLWVHTHDPDDLLRQRTWTSAELDVLLDTVAPDDLAALVRVVAGQDTDAVLAALDAAPVPVNANRRIEVTGRLRGAVDLTVPTLPSRRDDRDLPLAFGHRRLRLVAGRSWHVAAWGPLEGPWSPHVVRWPHFGVPSRTDGWRAGRFAEHSAPVSRLAGFMADLCEHIEYQLGTWTVEQELWEQGLFASLASGPTTFEGLQLAPLRQELGRLAEFLALLRRAQRGLVRRPDVDPLLSSPSVKTVCKSTAARLDARIDARRDRVRGAFALLADVAAGEQAELAERQRAATERLQHIVTVVTTVFLAPALIVSIYGANVRELSYDARGDLLTLTALMAGASVVTTLVFRAARSQPLLARSTRMNAGVAIAAAVCAVAIAVGIVTGRLGGIGWAAVVVVATAIATSAILSVLVARSDRTRRDGDHH